MLFLFIKTIVGGNGLKQVAQHRLGDLQALRFALFVAAGQEGQGLFGDVDAVDGQRIDDILAAQPLERVGHVVGQLDETLLNARQTERQHKACAVGIKHVRVVVVGHKIERLLQIDQVELVVEVQTKSWQCLCGGWHSVHWFRVFLLRKAVNNKVSGRGGFYRQTMHSYFLGIM